MHTLYCLHAMYFWWCTYPSCGVFLNSVPSYWIGNGSPASFCSREANNIIFSNNISVFCISSSQNSCFYENYFWDLKSLKERRARGRGRWKGKEKWIHVGASGRKQPPVLGSVETELDCPEGVVPFSELIAASSTSTCCDQWPFGETKENPILDPSLGTYRRHSEAPNNPGSNTEAHPFFLPHLQTGPRCIQDCYSHRQ